MFDLTWSEAAMTLLLFGLVFVTAGLPRVGDALGDILYGYRAGKRSDTAPGDSSRDKS